MGKVNSVTVTSSNIFHFSIHLMLLHLGETAVHTEKRHWLFREGSQRLPTRPTMKRWVWEVKMKCFVTHALQHLHAKTRFGLKHCFSQAICQLHACVTILVLYHLLFHPPSQGALYSISSNLNYIYKYKYMYMDKMHLWIQKNVLS